MSESAIPALAEDDTSRIVHLLPRTNVALPNGMA